MRIMNYAAALVIAALTLVLLVYGRPMLIPLAIAVMIAFLINALADRFGSLKLGNASPPGWLAMTASISAVGVFLWFVVNLITRNVALVSKAAPTYQRNLESLLERIYGSVGIEQAPTVSSLIGNIEVAPMISGVAGTLAGIVGSAGIVLVYLVFLMVEQNSFDKKIANLARDPVREKRLRTIIEQISQDIRRYVWVKTLTSLATGGISYIVLTAVGVDFAEFWGFVIFLLNFIPTIGSLLGIILPSLLTLVQFETMTPFFIVAPILGSLQFTIGNLIEPRLMGQTLNLSALVVILSLATWGSIWGIPGMFLSVPITAMLTIIFSNFPQTRPIAVLLSANGEVKHAPVE